MKNQKKTLLYLEDSRGANQRSNRRAERGRVNAGKHERARRLGNARENEVVLEEGDNVDRGSDEPRENEIEYRGDD